MYLFVGLGNPGSKYEDNRHNVGFKFIDHLAEKLDAPQFSEKFDSLHCRTEISGKRVFLQKPQTFMNKSGVAVSKLANFYKIPLQNIFVIYDELDLEFAKIKIKQAGGSGGHNGIKSIDSLIGKNYWRIRFGIDHPGRKEMVSSYVLSDFPQNEQEDLPSYFERLASNMDLLIKGERELFLTRYFE